MAIRRASGQSSRLSSGALTPTQRTQYSAHVVPQVQSSRAGLEGMGDAFARFFGQAQAALGDLQQIAHEGEMRRIEEQNEAEQVQATNDFYSGRGMDQNLTNDDDYMDTYRGLQANRVANGSARDFMSWYEQDFLPNNPMGNLEEARDLWVQQNLMGIDDPETQALALSRFYQSTEAMLNTHMENGIRMQRAQDMQTLYESLYDDAASGTMTGADVQWYIEAARRLDPLNFMEAAPRVVAGLMATVRNNPASAQQIITLLSESGTGMNGRSFAESFPDAFADFQVGALNAYIQTNTLEEREYFQSIEDTMINNPNMGMTDVATLLAQIQYGETRYGSANRADQLRETLASRMNVMAQTASDVSVVEAMMANPSYLDASHIREHFGDYLQSEYGTTSLTDIPAGDLARDLSRLGGVAPEDIRATLTNLLTNSGSVEGQQHALDVLTAIEAARGPEYVANYLSAEGNRWFNHVRTHIEAGRDPAEAIQRTSEARELGRNADEFDWRTATGETTVAAALDVVESEVDTQVQTFFGTNGLLTGVFNDNIRVPENVMNQIVGYAQTVYAERGADGYTVEGAVAEAVQQYAGMADIVGTRDNPVLLLRDPDEMNPNGQPRVRLGPNVMSPAGVEVNTHDIYLDELTQLGENAGWMFQNGDIEDVAIDYSSRMTDAFQIRQGGLPIVFEAGETFTWEGSHYIIPDTQEEVEAMFGTVFPEGFGLVANRDSGGELIGWDLMYRPHFGDYGQSLSDLEEAFTLGEARTPAMELQDMAMAIANSQEFRGMLPATAGVTNTELMNVRDARDIMLFVDNQLERGVQQQGYRFIDRHAASYDQTYRSRRQQLLVNAEAMHLRAYDDRTGSNMQPGVSAEGYVTVGIGFNMDRAGAQDTWTEVFGEDGPDFQEVYSGQAQISQAQAQRLFDHDMLYFENVVMDAADGRTLPEHQHLALLSVGYNSPRSIDEMRDDIAEGNHANVIHAILYDSYNPNHPQAAAIRSRRYQEARLYAGDDPALRAMLPSVQEFLGPQGITNPITGGLGIGSSFVADPSTDMRAIQPGRHSISVTGDRSASRQVTGVIGAAVETVLGSDARVVITSGHRPDDAGSQHSTSHAADVAIYDGEGRQLSWNDPRAQHIMMVAAQMGALGFGAGPNYMSGNHFHIDLGTGGATASRRGGIQVWSDDDGNGHSSGGPGAAQWLSLLQQSRQAVN